MMEWEAIKKNDDGSVTIPDSWLFSHYYEALNILFRFENSLRVFVYSIMKSNYCNEWKAVTFSMPGSDDAKSIDNLVKSRISQAKNFGYLGYDIQCPMMHLNSGELVELLTSDAYWKIFVKYFKGNKEIIKNKLLEIGSIRNSLAHFRPIKNDDIEVIKQNSKQTLLEVERCLESIILQQSRVPSNTDADWYRSFKSIGNEDAMVVLYHSKNEDWINIQVECDSPIISKNQYGNSFSYQLIRILTPNILHIYPSIKKYAIYISEDISYPQIDKEYDIKVVKKIHMVFSKKTMEDSYTEIIDEVRALLAEISEEMRLIEEDNLARGKICDVVSCYAQWSKPEGAEGSWNYTFKSMSCPSEPDHPEEYWGDISDIFIGTNMVTKAYKYPWMPTDISKWSIPF